jgi:ubiquinone/menaquinone biosynthesis C-methylase UbiE
MTTSWNSSQRFDRMASEWDENPVRKALADAVASAITETVKPRTSMQAMEFGCGTGLVTLALAPCLGLITALDTSEEMIAVLRKKTAILGIGNVQPLVADLFGNSPAAPLPENLDLIFSSMTLHHIADTGALLAGLFRMLRPGGIIALADLDLEDGFFHDDASEKVHPGFERGALQAMLQKAGFGRISFSTAHEISKTNRAGRQATYRIFLVTASKE